jgi:hypothetical protein
VVYDLEELEAIQRCGLRKFFKTSNMQRAKKQLLQILINYWEPDAYVLMLDRKPIKLEVEDIYFIIGLSLRGDIVNLMTLCGGKMTIEEYIATYCASGTQKVGIQFQIYNIESLSLKIILCTITRILGSMTLHQ